MPISNFGSHGSFVADLTAPDRYTELIPPVTRNEAVQSLLDGLTETDIFGPGAVRDLDMADLCRAGLWLYNDFWDAAHEIIVSVDTPSAALWHAIAHRRDEDWAKCEHWLREAAGHPALETLAEAAQDEGLDSPAGESLLGEPSPSPWDAARFAVVCRQCIEGSLNGATEDACVQIQRLEWQILFDYCYERAIS